MKNPNENIIFAIYLEKMKKDSRIDIEGKKQKQIFNVKNKYWENKENVNRPKQKLIGRVLWDNTQHMAISREVGCNKSNG